MTEVNVNSPFPHVRDLGETISSVLEFIREHFVKILQIFLVMVAPLSLLTGLSATLLTNSMMDAVTTVELGTMPDFSDLIVPIMLTYIVSILTTTMNITVFTEFCMLVHRNGGEGFSISNFFKQSIRSYPSNIGTFILVAIMTLIGAVFCILPGVYLAIPLTLIFAVRANEQSSFGNSISRCFSIIKGNWWSTFGTYLVLGIILFVLMMCIYVPLSVLGVINNMFSTSLEPSVIATKATVTTMVITTIVGIFNQFLLSSMYITHVFRYFSLAEQKDGGSVITQIDRIGSAHDSSLPEETY